MTDVYINGCATGITMQDSNYSLLRVGMDSCTTGIICEQGTGGYSVLSSGFLAGNGGFFNNNTTCISFKGLHWGQLKFFGGSSNTTGISVSQGARVGIRSDYNTGATNELNIEGAVVTYATMRAATPKVSSNPNYYSMIYESDF